MGWHPRKHCSHSDPRDCCTVSALRAEPAATLQPQALAETCDSHHALTVPPSPESQAWADLPLQPLHSVCNPSYLSRGALPSILQAISHLHTFAQALLAAGFTLRLVQLASLDSASSAPLENPLLRLPFLCSRPEQSSVLASAEPD